MYRIEMRLCSQDDLELDRLLPPLIVETKDGIINNAKNRTKELVMDSYGLLKGTFDEKVKTLKELEEKGESFFDVRDPYAKFILVEY